MTISLTEQDPSEDYKAISLTEPDVSVALPMDEALKRAAKAHAGLADMSPGIEPIADAINTGQEEMARESSVGMVQSKFIDRQLQIIKALSGQETPLTPEEQNTIVSTAKTSINNPDTIWEKLYAHTLIKDAITSPEENTTLMDATRKSEWSATRAADMASGTKAKQEVLHRIYADGEASWQKDGLVGKVALYGAHLAIGSPIWNLRLHDVIPGAPSNIPGNNLLEQRQSLWLLPTDEFQKVAATTFQGLYGKDRLAAFKWLESMIEYGESDRQWDNLSSAVDWALPALGPLARIPKGLRGITRPLGAPTEAAGALKRTGGITLPELQKTYPQASKEVLEGVVEQANKPQVPLLEGPPGSIYIPKREVPHAYVSGGRQFPDTDRTFYVTPEEAQQLHGEGKRHWFSQQGYFTYSEKTDKGYQPSGVKVFPRDEPAEGLVPMDIGPSSIKGSMGVPYYDQTKFGQVISKTISETREVAKYDDPTRNLLRAMGDVVRASNPLKEFDRQAIANAAGDSKTAAAVGAVNILRRQMAGEEALGAVPEETRKWMPSLFASSKFVENWRSGTQTLAQQIADKATAMSTSLMNAALNPARVARITDPAIAEAVGKAIEEWPNRLHYKTSGIREIYHIPATNFDNVHQIGIEFGKFDKSLFDTVDKAKLWAKEQYKFLDGDWTVKPRGTKFYIEVTRPIDETTPNVFEALVHTKGTETPKSWANVLFGRLRSAEDLLSPFNRGQRKLVTHAPQELRSVLQDAAKDIQGLPRRDRKEVLAIANQHAKWENPDTGLPGKFAKTADEFELDFHRKWGKNPTPAQVQAYDTYVRLNDFDGMLRLLGWHRDRSRMGIARWSITGNDNTASPFFDGKQIDGINWSAKYDEGIWFRDVRQPEGQFYIKNKIKNTEPQQVLDKAIKDEGFKVIQVYNPNIKPLAKSTDNNDVIHYVVTNAAENKRLQLGDGMDWRPGGHLIYQDPWFIKQAIIRTGTKGLESYYGDATIRGGYRSEKEAALWAKKYDEGRMLLKAGSEATYKGQKGDAALDLYVRENLPESFKEFKKLFTGAGPGGGLDADVPIVHTYTGRNSFESHGWLAKQYAGLAEQANHPANLAAQMDRKFLAERGPILQKATNLGTESNPIYKLQDAGTVDAFTALSQGLANAMRSRWYNDYKVSSAMQWIEEHVGAIQNGRRDLALMRQNPVYYLYHGVLDKSAVNREDYAAAKLAQKNIVALLGQRSELGANISWFEHKLMNGLYDLGLDKSVGSYLTNKPVLLAAIRDPSTYLKAAAFHPSLGFFNPVQYFLQAQAFTHSLAVGGPINGLAGFTGQMLKAKVFGFTDDPATIAKVDKIASKIGWKPGEWTEAYTAYRQSGVGHVAGETAWRDDIFDPQIFRGTVGTMLDKGTFFFRTGERVNRDTAFFTAFREWRRNNPTREIDNIALQEIDNRFSTMSQDMTRASLAAWQHGALSIPSQFMTFNMRIAEQFIGKRLGETVTQRNLVRARAIGMYSALYGIPVGLSVPTAFLPFYEDFRQAAINNNIDLNDKFLQIFHEGIVNATLTGATGRNYNVEQRIGPGASTTPRDVLSGKKEWWQFMPSTGIIGEVLGTMKPFTYSLWKGITADDNNQFPIVMEDFYNLTQIQNISHLSNAAKAIMALNTGKYITKNNIKVGDVNSMDAFMIYLGLTPQHITDTFIATDMLKARRELVEEATKDVTKSYQRGIEEMAKGNSEEGIKFFKRAKTLDKAAGMNWTEQSKAFKLGTEIGNGLTLMDKMNIRLQTQAAPGQQRSLIREQGQ